MGMEKYAKTIIPTIEANYERYTETERHIADYFLKNDAIGDLSAEFISTELAVSPASLSRFAKKSGYQGYREFVYEYRNSYVEKTTVEQEESRLVLDTYQSLLNKVYNLLDEAQIKRIVEKLRMAKRVYVCGRGSSGLAAEEMATRFRWIGIDMVALRDNENAVGVSESTEPRYRVELKRHEIRSLIHACAWMPAGSRHHTDHGKKQKVIRRLLQGSDTGAFLTTFKPRQSDFATVSASHDDRHYLCGLCKP